MPSTRTGSAYRSNATAIRGAAPHRRNATLPDKNDSPEAEYSKSRDNPAEQVIKQAVNSLIEQLNQGKSETMTQYLVAMARFHRYSFANLLAIFRARPDATHVAGIRTWNELGRFVQKGEKGIPILAPIIRHRRRKGDESDENATEQRQRVVAGWHMVYVFDVLQTHGRALPEPTKISGEVGTYLDRLIEFVRRQGIELEYNERIAPALGVSYGGKIALLPGQSKAETFNTLVHELGHLCCVGFYVLYG